MSQRVRVLKWELPNDDEPHEIGGGDVVLVERAGITPSGYRAVHVWTRELVDDDLQPTQPKRTAQVYGTGQLVDGALDWLGSFVDRDPFSVGATSSVPNVWHVFEVEQP